MKTKNKLKEAYFDEHVFYGLKNLNIGFNVQLIGYFSAEEFVIVLERVEDLGLGVMGIEPLKNGSYFVVINKEEYKDWGIKNCRDPQ